MPKYIAHWIIAEKAFQRLDAGSPSKRIIASAKNTYLTGSVVPDVPFYLIWGKDSRVMNKIGESIHDRRTNSYLVFSGLEAVYGNRVPESVLALMLGIIAHIQADAAFHPAIYSLCGMDSPQRDGSREGAARHHMLETYLELYIQHQAVAPYHGAFSECLRHMEMKKEAFLDALAALFSIRGISGRRMIQKALRMNALFQGLFPRNPPRRLLLWLNRIPGIDLSHFIAHFFPYPRPDAARLFQNAYACRHPVIGNAISFSVDGLVDLAVRRTVETFQSLDAAWPQHAPLSVLLETLQGPNLYTGSPDFGKTDMTFFDIPRDIMEVISGRSTGAMPSG